jgi:glycosyltransferase involved in cell wall biosynthesis
MTSPLRVLTSHEDEEYHRVIYDELAGRAVDAGIYGAEDWDDRQLDAELRQWDLFHLHWPEWFLGSAQTHRRFVAALRRADTGIVWSQHNLRPHRPDAAHTEIYQIWAQAADAVIHHSRWGAGIARASLQYRDDCIHQVIAHPHFGPLRAPTGSRQAVEAHLGWPPGVIRLAIVGSPRPGKCVADAVRAFSASDRRDLELRAFGLDTSDIGETAPNPRIHIEPYVRVDRATYDARLTACDALIMPFHATPMLTTGTVADAIAHGLPCLTSDWDFLVEVLGPAAIEYGGRPSDLTGALNRLSADDLARAAAETVLLRDRHAPGRIAGLVYDLLSAVWAKGRRAR